MTLEQRQEAGKQVERKLLEHLLQYNPTMELKVSEVMHIAHAARQYAFEAFWEDAT